MQPLLKHRYQVLQVLSDAGGFGKTFLAEDTDTPSRRHCVIKKLKPITNLDDFKFVQERFRREAAILERLGEFSHQIPKLYAYFVDNEEFYLVQELIDGLTLRQKVRQEGIMGEERVKDLLISLLKVLEYVHEQKIIHRDIKPDNVMLRQRDDQPVLIDFGIVKEVMHIGVDGNPTSTVMAGTPGYTSLEQVAGRPVFASDLYSLGATAIFLLTGKNPQQMTDFATGEIQWRQHAPKANPDLAAFLDKSTESLPRDRYQTAGEMLEHLRRVMPGDAQLTPSMVSPHIPPSHLPKSAVPISTNPNQAITEMMPPDTTEEETVVRSAPIRRRPKMNSLFVTVPTIMLLLFTIVGGGSYWLWSAGTNTRTLSPDEANKRGIAATVNGKSISLNEVDRILAQQLKGKQDQLAPHDLYQSRLQILNSLIDQELLFQRAEKEGRLPTESEVTDATNNSEQESVVPLADYQKKLRESGDTDRESVKRRLAIDKLINHETFMVRQPPDREVEEFFVNNRGSSTQTLDAPGVRELITNTLMVRAKNILVQALLETSRNEAKITNYLVERARSTSGFTSRNQND